jgi:hypothetical protein
VTPKRNQIKEKYGSNVVSNFASKARSLPSEPQSQMATFVRMDAIIC